MSDPLNNRNHPLNLSASEAVAVNAVTSVSSPAGEPEDEQAAFERLLRDPVVSAAAKPFHDLDTITVRQLRALIVAANRAATPPGGRSDAPGPRRMHARHVPDLPVLQFLADLNGEWAFWFDGHARSVRRAMPADTPDKVVLAKMRQLMKRGLVKGCGCGCRGDFEITDEGRAFLAASQSQPSLKSVSDVSNCRLSTSPVPLPDAGTEGRRLCEHLCRASYHDGMCADPYHWGSPRQDARTPEGP